METPLLAQEVDNLHVKVFGTRQQMGNTAGQQVSSKIKELLDGQDIVRMIFAAAPSQNEVLAYLAADDTIDWQRIDAFHMDEYIGLPADAPQRFALFLTRHLFNKVNPRNVHLITDEQGEEQACITYQNLLQTAPIDIVCLGIGENGHIAFNDPPVADFNDPQVIKSVELDDACRQQQVNDGCFPSFDDVPQKALTLTIPTLMAGKNLFCVVPGPTKKQAIKAMLTGPISTACPATILRQHPACTLYTDVAAYRLVNQL